MEIKFEIDEELLVSQRELIEILVNGSPRPRKNGEDMSGVDVFNELYSAHQERRVAEFYFEDIDCKTDILKDL